LFYYFYDVTEVPCHSMFHYVVNGVSEYGVLAY
jgi:hypothetical protein